MLKNIAITGIHTGIGKTIASAVLCEALRADYWKPIQAGTIENTDTMQVCRLITNALDRVHSSAVILLQPLSPHAAAIADGVTIDYTTFRFPVTENLLLIETAGGVLSPVNNTGTMADFVKHYSLPTILISANYLGSINHTLLSIEVLKNRDIPILGIVISGESNPSSEEYIEQYSGVPIIARIPTLEPLDTNTVQQQAAIIRESLLEHLTNAEY
jgi:dethiobiotin synthetase